ncbi:MAG: penicillin-binding protein 1A [Longimicrobiales bacterium]
MCTLRPARWALAATAVLVLACRSLQAQQCPEVGALRAYRPPEATRVYALDGSRLADLSPERRVVVDLKDVPGTVSNGFVAVEDRRFWSHGGVDMRGVGRAIVRNVTSLSIEEGFSTITMQLARQVFTEELPLDKKFSRKFCEVKLAPQIEKAFTKREILKMYMNQVYLGEGLYGVEEASRAFFGKSVNKVSVAEAALLIGLVKNPEGYNPRKHPMRAIQRRNVVLDLMGRERVITAQQAQQSKSEPLHLAAPYDPTGTAPYFIAAVRRELRERFGEDADTRGLRVYTGLDPVVQKAGYDALLAQIKRIEANEFGKYKHVKPDSGVKLEPAGNRGSPYLQGVVIALDPRTGEIRGLVGGRDFTHSQYDRVFHARRQPGSAFKPFVYAAAIQQGLTLNERIETTPVAMQAGGQPAWQPDDLVPDSVRALSVRDAFALSSNYGAIRVGQFVGPERVIEVAKAAGISTPIPPYPSIFLGAAEIIPADFVAAYATFGNGGLRVAPRLINRVETARGKVLWRAPYIAEPALDPGVAFLTLSLMEAVVDNGTGGSIRRRGFWLPAAGKTGTTNDAKDVWFVGMTTDLIAGVWLGFDQPKTIMANASGGLLAAPVWAEMMKAAYARRPQPGGWSAPTTLTSAPIDARTGLLASNRCPPENVLVEYFVPGTEPTHFCPLHASGAQRVLNKLVDGIRRIF